jgi:hypothetical protein
MVKALGIIILVDDDNRLISHTASKKPKLSSLPLRPGEVIDVIVMVNTSRCDTSVHGRGQIGPGTYRAVALLRDVDGVRHVEVPLEPPKIIVHAGGGYTPTE